MTVAFIMVVNTDTNPVEPCAYLLLHFFYREGGVVN